MDEKPIRFACAGHWLYGVLHVPSSVAARGVLVVVGGPQYRIGSHRQFVLLARALAAASIPVLRFDYRGMGDSEGEPRSFEHIAEDIRAAVDTFFDLLPSLREVVLWGLCDGASAALSYASADARISGLILLNPWVRTEQTVAQAYLRHYYLERLRDPSFWRKLAKGEFRTGKALRSLFGMLRAARGRSPAPTSPALMRATPLPERMLAGLQRFRGRVLLILSGDDITASEFKDAATRSRAWKRVLGDPRVTRRDLPGANHTFARRDWRDQVSAWMTQWLGAW
jgi:exosortase A-associated hydrolase 1